MATLGRAAWRMAEIPRQALAVRSGHVAAAVRAQQQHQQHHHQQHQRKRRVMHAALAGVGVVSVAVWSQLTLPSRCEAAADPEPLSVCAVAGTAATPTCASAGVGAAQPVEAPASPVAVRHDTRGSGGSGGRGSNGAVPVTTTYGYGRNGGDGGDDDDDDDDDDDAVGTVPRSAGGARVFVVGVDLTATTDALVEWMNVHVHRGDTVHVVHCHNYQPFVGFSEASTMPANQSTHNTWFAETSQRLDAAIKPLAASEGVKIRTHIVSGNPCDVIPIIANKKRADMIVVAATSKNKLTRALLGSVSTHLATHAEQTVVIVRGCVSERCT